MRISITFNGAITTVDVDPDMELINLKALIEAELTIPSQAQQLFHNGKPLNNDLLSVKLHGIKHDDILLVQAKQVSQSEQARHQILSNPQLKQQLISRNPQMEQALQDPVQFERIYTQMLQQQQAHDQRQSQLHNADEFDVEAQRQIEEEIRNQNIHRNYETAIEHNPEFFGRVIMLYINVEVNGVKVKAFVDSGAQATIMSPDCADRCNVMQILDTRFAGEARGVGTAKILGRIHSTQIKVGNQFLPVSMSVMEGKDVDLLFGLDVLKRHLAIIDLEKNCLRIHGEEVPFLDEHDLPEQAREKLAPVEHASASASGSVPLQAANQPVATKPTGQSAPATSTQATGKYPADVVQNLTALGVTAEEAIQALDACGGNPDLAANILFQ